MLQSSFLKFSAREELKGEYLRVFIGAIIVMIPEYIMTLVDSLAVQMGVQWQLLSNLLTVLVTVFIIDILKVGFIKSLMRMSPPNSFTDDAKRYDPEAVLSGFKERYGCALKITFVKSLCIFLWGLLAVIPIVLIAGIFAYLSTTPEMAELLNLVGQFSLSPTDETALYIGEYIAENCAYVIPLVMGAYVMMLALTIPVIYKNYEYIMIPYIAAEHTDITIKDAFKRSREIMHGFRRKYFCVELSFIGLTILPAIVMAATMSASLTYIAMAAIYPYMTMTYMQFYKERKIMLTPVEEGENNNEN